MLGVHDSARITHPLYEGGSWYLCHPAFGAIPFDTIPFGEIKLVDARLLGGTNYSRLDEKQRNAIDDRWIEQLMDWIRKKPVRSIYLVGGETKQEEELIRQYQVPIGEEFAWRSELAVVLPHLNPRRLRLVADDVTLLAFENWDNVYVNNITSLPDNLRRPWC